MEKSTKVVRIHDVKIDRNYMRWLTDIKARYHRAQLKAAVRVNMEKLIFNWELGRDLVERKAEEKWGSGIVEQMSLDLKEAFPDIDGFSAANLWRMKRWYLFYSREENMKKVLALSSGPIGRKVISAKLSPAGQESETSAGTILSPTGQESGKADGTKLSPAGQDFPAIFASVPWRHHVEIVDRCKDIDEAVFYLAKTVENNWSRNDLLNCIRSDYYRNHGKAITNFSSTLPAVQSRLAQEITKNSYDFSFAALPQGYDEEALESQLERHLTRFLLELGNGFAYLGRQKELVISGKTRRLDMLFFHIPLNCYVVIELKAVPFRPEFAGKLNFYVNAVDDLLKTEQQNPTVGILICSDRDQTEVQYSFTGISTPMGVSSYDNVRIEELKSQLPSIEELKRRISLAGERDTDM